MFKSENFISLTLAEVLRPVIPLIVISGTLNMCKVYSRVLATTRTLKIILPVTLTYFVPPLIANLVYKQFYVSNIVIGSFFAGCLIFPVLSRAPHILNLSASLCYIGKFGLFSSMRDNKQSISDVTLWLIVNEFVSIFILKILSNDHSFSISEEIVIRVLGNVILIYMCRIFHANDIVMVLLIIFADVVLYLKQRYLGEALKNVRMNERQGLKNYFRKRVDVDKQGKNEPKDANISCSKVSEDSTAEDEVKSGDNKPKTKKNRGRPSKNYAMEDKDGFQSAHSEADSLSEGNTVRLSDIQDVNAAGITSAKKKTSKKTPRKSARAKPKDLTESSDEKKSSVEKQTKKSTVKTPRRNK
ncbi:hypothetical protein VCUG_02416 [Vavraia culicis subsp. floridensis]|uniref:Uncharacterized protein n=1 Tax=Vavraia culicis (isolate floridensis) TaxID=948595 RepID=L2GS23_VAVCU|nr:uncharacterized protein VCUG_02416 [Vavraia culicis subsp. floridensis]ELA46108.1 hypothetical protein VCUG_02416 [Vavraia culicis subsp. floridensis]